MNIASPGPSPNDAAGLTRDSFQSLPDPRILVVDDDFVMRELLRRILQEQGFRVSLAGGGVEAVQIYQRHGKDIDLVLLDVRMPILDGPQTVKALQHLNPAVRCCLMSGGLGPSDAAELGRLGALRFFTKPFIASELVQVLRQLVGVGASAVTGPPAPPRPGTAAEEKTTSGRNLC